MMPHWAAAIGLAVALAAFLVLRTSWSDNVALPEITSESEEGFHDLTFAILRDSATSNGTQRLVAAGKSGSQRVEFRIVLDSPWRSGTLGDTGIATYSGAVSLESTGQDSDALVRAIDSIYGTAVAPGRMAKAARFAAISLEGNPTRLGDGPAKVKLFFESDDEDRYAEVFLNIDLAKRRVQLSEKDPDYRIPLVHALASGAARTN